MWVLFAFGSAMLAGLTSVLAKCGIKKTDSTVATAIRTIVVLIFSWLMVFVVGSQETISAIGGRTLLFLVLSGLATGASWLCYFKALQLGDVNKVVPIDKSSTVLTILLAAIFLQEGVSLTKGIGVVLIAVGGCHPAAKSGSGFPASVGGEELPASAGTPVWAVGREPSGSRVCVRNGVSSGSVGICRADAPKRHDERADGMDGIFHP